MPNASIIEAYVTVGALGVAFLVLIGIVVAWVKNIGPTLTGVKEALVDLKHETSSTMENNTDSMDNNTRAIEAVAHSVEEVARSNENVANMVKLLNVTLESQAKLIADHDKTAAERFTNAISQLKENHREITEQFLRHDDQARRVETEVGRVKGHIEQVKILIDKRE